MLQSVRKPLFPPLRLAELLVYVGIWVVGVYFYTQQITFESLAKHHISHQLPGIQRGYWPGRLHIDLSDPQYHFFRENLPLLLGGGAVSAVIGRSIRALTRNSYAARVGFQCVLGLCFMLFLTQSCFAFIVVIVLVNYLGISILKTRGRKGQRGGERREVSWAVHVFTWGFALSVLLANEYYHGYSWHRLLGSQYAWLDRWRGLFPWQNVFNLVVLKMISFNYDSSWLSLSTEQKSRLAAHRVSCVLCNAENQDKQNRGEKEEESKSVCYYVCEKEPLGSHRYTLAGYFAFLFYPPLYIAGPTLTYNALHGQWLDAASGKATAVSWRAVMRYSLRVLVDFLALEWYLHYTPTFALTQRWTSLDLSFLSADTLCFSGTWILMGIYMKFVVIWRVFRMLALWDGVESVENMKRCIYNNYTIRGFWQNWHVSFNKWLVRYIYVPLGGGKGAVWRKGCRVFVVFTFVAIWHDRTLQLLAWGWLTVLTFVPEIVVQHYADSWLGPRLAHNRYVIGVGGVCNLSALIVANLVGYSFGVKGMRATLRDATEHFSVAAGLEVLQFLVVMLFTLTQLMLARREWERRQQTHKKKQAV